jgi:hypothetical protein
LPLELPPELPELPELLWSPDRLDDPELPDMPEFPVLPDFPDIPEEFDDELPERPEPLPEEELSSPNDDSSLRSEFRELLPERGVLPLLLLDPLMPPDLPWLLCESEDPDDPDDPVWLELSLFRSFAIHPPALPGRTENRIRCGAMPPLPVRKSKLDATVPISPRIPCSISRVTTDNWG